MSARDAYNQAVEVFAPLGPGKDWLCEQGRFGLKTPDPKIKAVATGQSVCEEAHGSRWRSFSVTDFCMLYAFRREVVARPTAAASSFTVVAARRCGCAAVAGQSLKLQRVLGPGGSGGRRKAG